jgi:peptide/nickel transport system substrate-binding protein
MLKKMNLGVCITGLVTMLSLAPAVTFAKDTLTIGLQDDTASFDPVRSYETASAGIRTLIYEMLVGLDQDASFKPVPKLANSWELVEGNTWIFHLKQNVFFASGNPLTADDVVFSLRRALKFTEGASWLLAQFGMTENSITKVDEYTVQLVLKQQYAPGLFLSCLWHPVASILDSKLVIEHESNGDLGSAWLEDHSAGSGPYILQQRTREKPTEYVLIANDRYWSNSPKFQKIIVKGIQDSVEQMAMLEQGELDIAWNLQPEQVMLLGSNPDIQISETLTLYNVYIGMNQGYAPLEHIEVREAIRYAIDYDRLIAQVVGGAGVKHQTFIPDGLLGYSPEIPYAYDVQRAKQLLSQGGYPDGFDVDLYCLNYSPWIDLANQIKRDLTAIGIDVEIVQLPAEKLFEVWFARETQLLVWEWGIDYADPDAMAKPFAHSDSLGNDATIQQTAWWFKYVNTETSKLVEKAAKELDPEKRAQLYQEITQIILHDGPYAFLFTKVQQYGVRIDIANLIKNPSKVIIPFPQLK